MQNASFQVLQEGLMTELAQEIRETCPEFLCQDLVFSAVELSCSETDNDGHTTAQFSALATAVGAQEYVRAFLRGLTTEPLTLHIHGTSVEATPIAPPTSSTSAVGRIAGPSGGGFIAVLALAALTLACVVWNW